jgi:hypothetical protein
MSACDNSSHYSVRVEPRFSFFEVMLQRASLKGEKPFVPLQSASKDILTFLGAQNDNC